MKKFFLLAAIVFVGAQVLRHLAPRHEHAHETERESASSDEPALTEAF